MRAPLSALLLLVGCVSACEPAPAPLAPAAAPPAPVVAELRGQTHLDEVLSRTPVSMTGTLDRRVTLAWGGLQDALSLPDGRIVALRMPRIDQASDTRTETEAALRASADALVGQRVSVVGDLHIPLGGEFSLSSVPARDGGGLESPMVDIAVTLQPSQLVSATDDPDFGVPDVTVQHRLNQHLRAADVQALGVLQVTENDAGHPGFLIELQDGTPLELRVVVEAAPAARSLHGQPVLVVGRLALADDGRVHFEREVDAAPVTRRPTLALEAKSVRALP